MSDPIEHNEHEHEAGAPGAVTENGPPTTDVERTMDSKIAEFFEHTKSLTSEDPEVVQERILRALLDATSAHDVLHAGEAIKAADVDGIPLEIQGIRASESEYVDGSTHYLHIDAKVLGNGDQITVSCGARDVVMKLIRLDQLAMFPVTAKIVKSGKATKDGFFPLFLQEVKDF